MPRGLIFDYGGTLVEERRYDADAGLDAVLAMAVPPPTGEVRARIAERAALVARDVAGRRDEWRVETPWPSLTRLIHHAFGLRFTLDWPELEQLFWDASVTTVPTPGIVDALTACKAAGVRMAVLSNASFGSHVIRHELDKHGLGAFFDEVLVTADYAVRKPNPLVFDVAVARLGVPRADTWVIGDRLDTDIAGARAAGLTTAWYAAGRAAGASEADVVLTHWDQLTRLISGRAAAHTTAGG